MKEIRNTDKLIMFEVETKTSKKIYRQSKEDEKKERLLIYTLLNDKIEYEFAGESIKKIIIQETDEIPTFLSSYGYGFIDKSLNNFFRYKFRDSKIDTLILSEAEESSQARNQLTLSYDDINYLLKNINQEQRACNDNKKSLIKNLIINIYPEANFDYSETNNNKELILRNLNDKLIEKLTSDEIQKLGEFYVKAARKYKASHIIKKMNAGLMKNAQILSLQEIIVQYEKLLNENPAEAEWQKFFNDYITLFDNRYVHKIDYKNIATGITKYPDLVLVDIYGYVDFYELKKCGTELLQYDKSHKTWFWSKDVSMVISQVSDYLQKAKENSLSYSKAIKDETETETEAGLNVNIINPRAIIVIGTTAQLNTEKKKNHFKNLRENLKDIEFVLYDELLERLKNLLDSIKLE